MLLKTDKVVLIMFRDAKLTMERMVHILLIYLSLSLSSAFSPALFGLFWGVFSR
jgi:hypothetical protein